MSLEQWVRTAREAGASDVHLEGGLPLGLRIGGQFRLQGGVVDGAVLMATAREVCGLEGWELFRAQHSFDVARTIAGVRCRINVMHSMRGVGMVIRLLSAFQATLRKLNLHPSLRRLIEHRHGLVIVSGPTGSGKSSTLAALIQEINLSEARHIITIENPIEHLFAPVRSLIRQREVGRHTPSVDQALIDALREDPDVLMVGEMRDPETMRLTLNAAETGHLVLATLHSASPAEALQRVVSAFPAELQGGISSQLADCLVGVVSQRLRFRTEVTGVVPECELLVASSAVKSLIRQGAFFKLATALESGGAEGNLSLARYQDWLNARTDWFHVTERELDVAPELPAPAQLPLTPKAPPPPSAQRPTVSEDGVLVIDEGDDLGEVLAQLDRRKK